MCNIYRKERYKVSSHMLRSPGSLELEVFLIRLSAI